LNLQFDVVWFSAFLLAMVRATAWLFVAPPFNANGIPQRVKLGLAVAFALFAAPHFPAGATLGNSAAFIPAVLYEAVIGLAMGFGVQLLVSAVQSAGALIDFSAGFSAAAAFDPMSNSSSTPFGRLYSLLATAILFASGGHRVIVKGFLTSFNGGGASHATIEEVGRILAHDFSTYFAATLQMAVPLVAALFLAETALGLLAKAVPQMNIISIGFAVKTGTALLLGGLAIKALPAILFPLVTQAAETMIALGGVGGA
jgi:flagellar biosynthesis protein FliR